MDFSATWTTVMAFLRDLYGFDAAAEATSPAMSATLYAIACLWIAITFVAAITVILLTNRLVPKREY